MQTLCWELPASRGALTSCPRHPCPGTLRVLISSFPFRATSLGSATTHPQVLCAHTQLVNLTPESCCREESSMHLTS